jgi:hypothetical protein
MPQLTLELAHEVPFLFLLRLADVVRTKQREMGLGHGLNLR